MSENNISDKEIVAEADRLDMKDRAVLALAEILLDKDILTQIPKYRVLFLRFLATNQKSQKHFMGAFEILVGQLHKNDLLPKTAKILSTLYDQDFIEEEVLLEWGSKVKISFFLKSQNSFQFWNNAVSCCAVNTKLYFIFDISLEHCMTRILLRKKFFLNGVQR